MFLHNELKMLTLRAARGILLVLMEIGGGVVASKRKKASGKSLGKGVRVYKDAVPKTGTKLTRERISGNFRSLNKGRTSG